MPRNSPIRRTKIVATLGPSWEEPDQIRALLDAGVNVVRINSSHGTPEIRSRWISSLKTVIGQCSSACAILVDLQGPRIRVGGLPEPLALAAKEVVTFAPEELAGEGEIPTTYEGLAGDVHPGSRILLDDGLLTVDVTEVRGDRVRGTVRYAGILKANKGMNLPGIEVSAPAITDKDRDDALLAAELGVDFIGMSFVRRPEDLEAMRRLLPKSIKLIAKIEKDTALRHLDGIIESSDAIMVARGDLGVELPFEQVPLVQKRLIREANRHGKPVITATQMLESMIVAPRPTRAEVSDVANAILDGTDAVMLSAETAVGKYPLEAVRAMDRIAREVESHRREGSDEPAWESSAVHLRQPHVTARTEDAISVAVCAAAELLKVPLIVCLTSSGFTARTVASYRPTVPILAVTPEEETFRQLALVWGVIPARIDHYPDYDKTFPVAQGIVRKMELAAPGERVVVTAGVPFDVAGTTNFLKIESA
ncbi:MAG TPA: pyruvate kinase [Gemmatimonadales bacterium]|nr:pyruvate kinase [Gemmatimonadales bacterium]